LQNLSDRALKERIIGAIVLVVFAVLVVPVFLDGPPGEEKIVSEAVTLPGQNSQARNQQTIVLDRDRSHPVPATNAPEPAAAAAVADEAPAALAADEPAEVVEEAALEPESAPLVQESEPPEAEISETGMWAVQLGSFSNQDNAERLASSLRDQGYAAFLSQLRTDAGPLHRVRIGPQKDRESAEAIAAQLARGGHQGQVVPHP